MATQDLDRILAQVGMAQQDRLSPTGMVSPTQLAYRPGQFRYTPPPQPPEEQHTGMWDYVRQFGWGIAEPAAMGLRKLGLTSWEPPEPTNPGEQIAHIVGSLGGWAIPGAVASFIAAPLTAGLVAPAATAKLGMAGKGLSTAFRAMGAAKAGSLGTGYQIGTKALHSALASGITGGYAGWARDGTPEEMLRDALYGTAFGAALPVGIYGVQRGVRSEPFQNAMDVLSRRGARPADFSDSQLRKLLHATGDRPADELYNRVMKRVQQQRLELPSSIPMDDVGTSIRWTQLAQRPKGEQLAVMTRLLDRDPRFESAFQPVFKYANQLKKTNTIMSLDQGVPKKSRAYQQALRKIGDSPAIKGVHTEIDARIDKGTVRTLSDQIQEIEGMMRGALRKQDNILVQNRVRAPEKLSASAFESWEKHRKFIESLDGARFKLLPKVQEAMGLADAGMVGSLTQERLKQDMRQHLKEIAQPVRGYHNELMRVLEKHGVGSHRQLTTDGRRDYAAVLQRLRKEGVTYEDIRPINYWLSNPMQISEKAAGEIRKNVERYVLPDVIDMTSLDDLRLMDDVGVVTRWLSPIRHIFGEAATRPMRIGHQMFHQTRNTYLKKSTEILRPFMGWTGRSAKKQSRERITEILEGTRSQAESTAAEWKAATQLRQLFNTMGKEFNIDSKRFLEFYVPRLRRVDSFGTFERQLKDVMSPQDVKFFAEFKRSGLAYPREKDIFSLVQAYIRGGANVKHLKPALDSVEKALVAAGTSRSKMKLFKNLSSSMLGMPTETEILMDNALRVLAKKFFVDLDPQGRHTRKIVSLLTELQYAGTLGYNPFTAIKNLTQQILAISHLDPDPMVGLDYWSQSASSLFTRSGKNLSAMNPVRTSRMPLEAIDLQQLSLESVPGLKHLQRGAFWMFRQSDLRNVDTSFNMKLLHSLDRGKPMKQAIEEAYSFVMSTQFMYGFDSPMLYKEPLGRLVGILGSWPINWAHLMKEQIGGPHKSKAIATIMGMALGAEALSLSGLSFRSIRPTETASGMLPVAMFQGEQGWPISLRAAYAGGEALRSLTADPETRREAFDKLWQRLQPMIPYSTMAKRVIDTQALWRQDWVAYDEQSRVQYELAREGPLYEMFGIPGEGLRGMIGPTVENQRRWETMEMLRNQDNAYRAARKQAIDALLEGDIERFQKMQQHLLTFFGRVIESHDIERELEMRGMTAVERRMMGLPEEMRMGIADRIMGF